jgi:predicted dehydrogenase
MPVELAAELSRDRGRVVDIGKCKLDLPWNSYYEKELDVRFSRSYGPGRYDTIYEELGIDYPIGHVRWTERRNMECIIAMLETGRLDLSTLISTEFPFESAVDVYEGINRGEIKGVGFVFHYNEQTRPLTRVVTVSRPVKPVAGKIRVGVIGAGNYASSMLLPHLAKNADVILQEVATTSSLSATNALRKFGFARSSTEPEKLLKSDDIDAVVIATRHASHSELVCAGLRSGKAIFVEKPLAISNEALGEIEKTIVETGNDRLVVGFNRRFSPLLKELKADWGQRSGSHNIHYRINADPLDKGSWYLRTETEGTRFVGEGGHFIDVLNWWLGAEPAKVMAAASHDDIDNLTAIFEYPDGSVATISYWTQGDPRLPKERIEIFGQGNAACFDNFERYDLWKNGRKTTKRKKVIDKGQNDQLDAFVASIKNGTSMPITLSSLVMATKATLAAQRSVVLNAPVLFDQ